MLLKERHAIQKKQVIMMMKAGYSQNQASIKLGIPPNKVTRWKRVDPKFKKEVDELRLKWARKWNYMFNPPIEVKD